MPPTAVGAVPDARSLLDLGSLRDIDPTCKDCVSPDNRAACAISFLLFALMSVKFGFQLALLRLRHAEEAWDIYSLPTREILSVRCSAEMCSMNSGSDVKARCSRRRSSKIPPDNALQCYFSFSKEEKKSTIICK